jgi:hypothetical protein
MCDMEADVAPPCMTGHLPVEFVLMVFSYRSLSLVQVPDVGSGHQRWLCMHR